MPTRTQFESELRSLQDDLLVMSDLVSRAIGTAVRSLSLRDADLAREVVEGDERINGLWVRIERETLQLIATQQPMATDLREILAIVHIATDLERMGDYAKGIATVALRVMEAPSLTTPTSILRMSDLVCQLLKAVIATFIARDDEEARAIAARDNEVDAIYQQVYHDLITTMTKDAQAITEAERLLWVAKSLERIGDHITNIGERVVFVATGQIVELNG